MVMQWAAALKPVKESWRQYGAPTTGLLIGERLRGSTGNCSTARGL